MTSLKTSNNDNEKDNNNFIIQKNQNILNKKNKSESLSPLSSPINKRRKISSIIDNNNNDNDNDNTIPFTDDELIEKNIIPPEVLYRLKDFSLFNDAPNSFFLDLSKTLNLVQYRPQEYIVKAGEPAKSMYWILRGTVRVTSTDGESTYAELAAGSFFGEIGILFNRPRTATVVARTKVLLGILTKDSLNLVLSNYPKIERIIRDEAQQRLSMQEKRKNLLKMSLPTISRKVSIVPTPISETNNIFIANDDNNTNNTNSNDNNNSNNNNNNNPTNDINNIDNNNNNNNNPTKDINNNTDNNIHSNDNTDDNSSSLSIDNSKIINSSLVANHHDIVPGPSLPPVSLLLPLSSSTLENSNINKIKNNNENNNSNDPTFSSLDTIDNTISIREFLYNLPIFATLPNNIIHELALSIEVVHYRPMNYIIKKGDLGRDIYFIVYGEVEVINEFEVLARLSPNMYFGEFAFLSTLNNHRINPRSADVRTITDCEILVIKASTLDSICIKYPTIAKEFKKTAFERTRKNIDDNKENNQNNGIYLEDIDFQNSQNIIDVNDKHNNNGKLGTYDNSNDYNNQKDYNNFSHNEIQEDDLDRSSSASFVIDAFILPVNNGEREMTSSNCERPLSFNGFNDQIESSSMFKSFSFDNQSTIINSNNNSNILNNLPCNPKHGSISNFSNFQKSNFQYAPLEFRRRLSNINHNRRRSSILNIGPFPDSIVLKIFQILDLKTLMKCSSVCIRWKQLIYLSNGLFKKLDLKPWCKEIDDNIIIQITKLVGSRPQLIDISNCYHITDEGFTYMINEIGIRGNIKELIMKNDWNLSAMAMIDLSVVCKSLIKLDLSNCRKVKDDVIIRLIGSKNNLNFGCHELNDLKLGYCKYLTDKTMQHIIINSNDILISLDLTRCTTITDLGFSSMMNIKMNKLKRLILKDCTFLSDKVVEMISISCLNLEILDLTFCCMLTDYSLKMISLGCSKLVDLNLSFCGAAVSDYSLMNLKNLINLEYLAIKGCVRVTREGVDMILTGMSNLKELNVLQCSRINYYKGILVDPFEKVTGFNFCCLKIKTHGRIVKVLV